jgi:hypothetical protein
LRSAFFRRAALEAEARGGELRHLVDAGKTDEIVAWYLVGAQRRNRVIPASRVVPEDEDWL